ncbi:uncharacterized protein LOC143963766 isoform X4 [Lithobates pipiens]
MSGHHRDLSLRDKAQESTPNMGKTTDGVPALSSLEYDVMSTPSKRAQKRKHMIEEEPSIEGGAGKRTSPSLEKSCVRRTLSVLLSHLKGESDQSLAGIRKAQDITPLQSTSTPHILHISSKNTPVGSLQEDPSEKKCDLPPETRRENKCLVVELVRLREESENLKDNVFKGKSNSENGTDQKSSAGIRKAQDKTPLQSTPTPHILHISSKNTPVGSLQEDPSEKKCDLPPETRWENKRLVVELVRLREESENLKDNVFKGKSNSENGTDLSSAGIRKAQDKTPLQSTPTPHILHISSKNTPVGNLQEDPSEKKCDLPPETRRENKCLVVELLRLREESENLKDVFKEKSNSENGTDQKSSAGIRKAQDKTPLQSTPTPHILHISSKNTPVGNLQEDPSEKKCDLPPEMRRGNKRLVVELVRLREESENLKDNVFKGKSNSENGTDQQESGSGVSVPSTYSTAPTNGVRRSVRNKKLQYDTLEEEKLSLETDDEDSLLANVTDNPKIVEEKPSTDESDSEEKSDEEQMELSAYERERLKNIKENAKFLNAIKLLETVASLHSPKKKNPNRVKREKPQNTGNTVVRCSLRLQNIAPSQLKLKVRTRVVEENVRLMKPPDPIEMIPVNQQADDKAMDQFMRMWTSISQETIKTPTNKTVKDLESYEKSLKKMKLRAEDVAKIVPGLVRSVAIHPSERRTLVACGDHYGNVGLWNVGDSLGEKEMYVFDLHSRSVGYLSFCPWNPAHLLSISYDGTMRCGDVTRSVFDEIYRDEEESFSFFSFYSADGSVLVVSHWDSTISLMDRRTPGTTYEVRSPVDLLNPRTVSVHPLQRELCVVAGAGDVCIYDVRQISSKKLRPVVSLPGHSKYVSSAFFSPVTGNRVLTTCTDRLRVFDSSSPSSTFPLLTSLRRQLYMFSQYRSQALWDPKQEDCFVVGSRFLQIEVYHENGNLVDYFRDENLNSACTISIMHPTRSILVGGSCRGKLYLFRNQCT